LTLESIGLMVAILAGIVLPIFFYMRSKRRQVEFDNLRDENEKLKALLENVDVYLDPKNPPKQPEGLSELEGVVRSRLGKPTGVDATTLVKLGNISVSTKNFGQAMRYYAAARRVARTKGDDQIRLVALDNAGMLRKARVGNIAARKGVQIAKPTGDINSIDRPGLP
jgi:hypothetical protein